MSGAGGVVGVGWSDFRQNRPESDAQCRPGSLKPGLTLLKRRWPDLYSLSLLHPSVAQTQRIPSNASCRPSGGQAKTLDLGFVPIEGGQLALHITKPSQIGVGQFLAQRALGLFQLSI